MNGLSFCFILSMCRSPCSSSVAVTDWKAALETIEGGAFGFWGWKTSISPIGLRKEVANPPPPIDRKAFSSPRNSHVLKIMSP